MDNFDAKLYNIQKMRPEERTADTLIRVEKSIVNLYQCLEDFKKNTADGVVVSDMPDIMSPVVQALAQVQQAVIQAGDATSNAEVIKAFKEVSRDTINQIKNIRISVPQVKIPETVVNLPEPKVVVNDKPVDFKPIQRGFEKLEKTLSGLNSKLVDSLPEEYDDSDVVKSLKKVSETLEKILARPIPVPEIPPVMKVSNPDGSTLGTGIATSANQVTGNTSLTNIESDTDFRFGGGKSAYVVTISASGNTTLITPAAGNRIRLFWIAFVPNSDNGNANLIKLGFGTTGGSIATELYRGYALAHWEVFTGTANQSVIVNATTAEPVAFTIHYQEVS